MMPEISPCNVFDCEIDALIKTRNYINEHPEAFNIIIETLYNCKGKVIVTGIGKSGHIAQKISSTLSSLGTSSIFMNAAEAMHGDLGMIQAEDVVILVSKSGESDEINTILPNIKLIGATTIALTSRSTSTLATNSDIVFQFPDFEEACHLNLAPTSSTTSALVLGDAIAISLSERYGFTAEDFGIFHPGGLLGRCLITTTENLIQPIGECAVLSETSSLTEVIAMMCKYPSGIAALIKSDQSVAGVLSDGDVRRLINARIDIYTTSASEVMTKAPLCFDRKMMAARTLALLQRKQTHAAPVINEKGECIGIITVNAILGAGIKL